jgi:hypothetical protein
LPGWAVASEPTTVAVVEANGDEDDLDETGAPVTVVERDALRDNVGGHTGQRIRVRGVESTGRLGPAIFWGELGDPGRQVPILVRLDPAQAGTLDIRQGVAYTITGEIHQVTEDELNTWAEQGEFAGEGEQLQATFADYYIQASSVRPTTAARAQPES